MQQSLRARLMANLLAVTGLVWFALVVAGYEESRHELEEVFDAELAQIAKLLVKLVGGDAAKTALTTVDEVPLHDYEKKLSYAAWTGDGKQVFVSGRLFQDEPRPTSAGYDDLRSGGERWRILTIHNSGITVRVAEQSGARDEYAQDVAERLLLPLLAAVPLLGGLIWFSIGRSLQPLEHVAASVAKRHPFDLHEVRAEPSLRETAPLVTALNTLFARLQQAFESERRFTCDAAHELRTPLAGLAAQYEVATLTTDLHTHNHALGKMKSAIDHMAQLVQQLLVLARCDTWNHNIAFASTDVGALVHKVADELSQLADERNAKVIVSASSPLRVDGHTLALRLVLRNLIDNSLRYSPAPAQVHVVLADENDEIAIHVSDSGPGIPLVDRERVFQRFFRCHANDVPGTGLGLCIVQRCVELHRGRVALQDSPLGGLHVAIRIPKQQPTTIDTTSA